MPIGAIDWVFCTDILAETCGFGYTVLCVQHWRCDTLGRAIDSDMGKSSPSPSKKGSSHKEERRKSRRGRKGGASGGSGSDPDVCEERAPVGGPHLRSMGEPVQSPMGILRFYASSEERSPPLRLDNMPHDADAVEQIEGAPLDPLAQTEGEMVVPATSESEEDVVRGPRGAKRNQNRLTSRDSEEERQRSKVDKWIKECSKTVTPGPDELMSTSSEETSPPDVVEKSDRKLRSSKRVRESVSGPSPQEVKNSKKKKKTKAKSASGEDVEVADEASARGKKAGVFNRIPYRTRLSDPSVGNVGLQSLHSSALGAQAIGWAREVDELRVRSGNIKGNISGVMKVKLARIGEALAILVSRIEDTGDPQYLRMMAKELGAQIADKDAEIARLRDENGRLKGNARRNVDGGAKARIIEEVVITPDMPEFDRRVVVADPEDRPQGARLPPVSGEESPLRPARVSALRRTPRGASDVEGSPGWLPGERSLDREMTARIDFLVNKRRELRREIYRDAPRRGHERASVGSPSDVGRGERRQNLGALRTQPPPPPAPLFESEGGESEGWQSARGRRKRRVDLSATRSPPLASARGGRTALTPRRRPPSGDRRRPPRAAAILVKGKEEGFSYRDALLKARETIPIQNLDTRVRRAANGGLLIEVLGENGAESVDKLASEIGALFGDAADVRRPIKRAEMRLRGLDDSVSREEIALVLAQYGRCAEGDIHVGPLRAGFGRSNQVWVQLPLVSALGLANLGRVKMGWSSVRLELLEARPSQCYKCWRFGHVRGTCTSTADYSGRCFNCGDLGHHARDCKTPPKCLPCAESGSAAPHRVGSRACAARFAPQSVNRRTNGYLN